MYLHILFTFLQKIIYTPNPTRIGHTFIGWNVDFSNITDDLTVTALYSRNVSPTPPPTPPTPPIPPVNPNPNPMPIIPQVPTTTPSPSSSDSSGTSSPPAVNNTITATTESGVSVNFTFANTPTGGVTLTASAAAILKAANSGDDLTVRIPLPSGGYIDVTLDNAALVAIAEQAGKLGNITLTINFVDKAKLSSKDRQLAGDAPVFEFVIMGVRTDKRITDLDGGTMTITVSRGLTTGEDNNDRTIFYLDSNGKVRKSEAGKYSTRKNGLNHRVTFTFTEM